MLFRRIKRMRLNRYITVKYIYKYRITRVYVVSRSSN